MAAKSSPRLNKAATIREIEARIEWGRALSARAVDDHVAFADVMVERLEWQASVLTLLPAIAKGIEAVADFTRGRGPASFQLEPPLSEDVLAFRREMRAQLESLERTLERIRKIGTRQLG
jgi:hypothetical protein